MASSNDIRSELSNAEYDLKKKKDEVYYLEQKISGLTYDLKKAESDEASQKIQEEEAKQEAIRQEAARQEAEAAARQQAS